MQASMDLKVLGDRLNAFPYAVANDQKEEASPPQVQSQSIIEGNFVHIVPRSSYEIKNRVVVPLQISADFPLKSDKDQRLSSFA